MKFYCLLSSFSRCSVFDLYCSLVKRQLSVIFSILTLFDFFQVQTFCWHQREDSAEFPHSRFPGHQGPDRHRGLNAEDHSPPFAGPTVTGEEGTLTRDELLCGLGDEASHPTFWKTVPDTGGQRFKKYHVCVWSRYIPNSFNIQLSYCTAHLFHRKRVKCFLLALRLFTIRLLRWQEIGLPHFGLEQKASKSHVVPVSSITQGKLNISRIKCVNLICGTISISTL